MNWESLGEAAVLLWRSGAASTEKRAADALLSYGLKGKLHLSKSGWLMLTVPNDLGIGAFKALNAPGAELPISESTGQRRGPRTSQSEVRNSPNYVCCQEKKMSSTKTIPPKPRKGQTAKFVRHGMRGTPTHTSWRGMLDRCRNPNHSAYKNYGVAGFRSVQVGRRAFSHS